jgi:hypothetical protein
VLHHEGETRPQEEAARSETAAPAKKRNARIQFSSFLPRSRSKVVFALVMASYSWALSSIIVYWRSIAGVEDPGPTFYAAAESAIGEIFLSLVFAPIFETLILVGVFELVRRAGPPERLPTGSWSRSTPSVTSFPPSGRSHAICDRSDPTVPMIAPRNRRANCDYIR